jgi:hypothetical protein
MTVSREGPKVGHRMKQAKAQRGVSSRAVAADEPRRTDGHRRKQAKVQRGVSARAAAADPSGDHGPLTPFAGAQLRRHKLIRTTTTAHERAATTRSLSA